MTILVGTPAKEGPGRVGLVGARRPTRENNLDPWNGRGPVRRQCDRGAKNREC